MNCRNEEKFISTAINSVLFQTYKNFELLIWDDASNDNTLKIIKSFDDKRIKIFGNKTHLGLGLSRCKAQREVNGELVAILDADDEMSNNRIEKQVNEFLMNENLALIGSWIKYKNTEGKVIREKFYDRIPCNIKATNEEIRENMVWRNIFAHSSIMYKKQDALRVGWYSTTLEYAQDYDLSIKLIKDKESKILNEYLTFITERKESMTSSAQLKKRRIQENLHILESCRSQIKMGKRLSFINLRAISVNKLKLDLISDSNLIVKFFFIFKTLIKFPSLLFFRFFK
tara:strand:+ start:777 stop:1634 length:858 start_codon:yes stop_codon:yes gene_type:complete